MRLTPQAGNFDKTSAKIWIISTMWQKRAHYKQLLLLPQCFQKSSAADALECIARGIKIETIFATDKTMICSMYNYTPL